MPRLLNNWKQTKGASPQPLSEGEGLHKVVLKRNDVGVSKSPSRKNIKHPILKPLSFGEGLGRG
jgi:hypothetical protein